jgi:hypothetical protein
MDKQTYTIYPLPLDSREYKNMCRIKFYLYRKFFLEGGDVGVFFNEKGSKGKKVLLQDMHILFLFLKLIFDGICIPPPKKKIGVYRTSAVRSFVCPSGRHTFSSLRHAFKFCSNGVIY